jgi:hypothetical protein
MITLVTLLNRALVVIKSSKTAQKREMLKTLFSNLCLNAEKLQYAYVSPLSELVNIGNYKKWLTSTDGIRKHHYKQINSIVRSMTPELLEEIESD